MTRNLTIAALLLCAHGAAAQVRVDKPVVLNGATDQQRQVTGLTSTTVPAEAVNAEVQLHGTHRTVSATNGAAWAVNVAALTGPLTAGTNIVVQAPVSPTPGQLAITVNGDGPYAVLKSASDTLVVGSPDDAPMLSLIFDGSNFRMANGSVHKRRDCPSGMVAVNEQYCIEVAKRDTVDWYQAGRDCVGEDRRLCTWGEWHSACTKAALLGLQEMLGEWEWTCNPANEDGWVRIAGGASCTSAGTADALTAPSRFRCCSTR